MVESTRPMTLHAFRLRVAVATCWLALLPAAAARAGDRVCGENPFAAFDAAVTACRQGPGRVRVVQGLLDNRRTDTPPATWSLQRAELMKCVGDPQAASHYKSAVEVDDDPAFELFYADYLRNFRGAQRPMFPAAERHYFAGLEKSRRLRESQSALCEWDSEVANRLRRGVIVLYQEDGVPLSFRGSDAADPRERLDQPFLFLSASAGYAHAGSDLDQIADVRDYTAEAALARSRRAGPLTDEELRGIVRVREPFATTGRIRARYKRAPAVDAFYSHRGTRRAQVTNFFRPTAFNALRLDEYGVFAESPFTVGGGVDLALAGGYRKVRREGLLEFLPETPEDINQYEARAGVSRFAGPDKVNVKLTFVHQGITPRSDPRRERNRNHAGATFTYQLFRPIGALQNTAGRRFDTRGIDLSTGILHDREFFSGATDQDGVVVRRRDYFVGLTARGLGRFDVNVQPTFFTFDLDRDGSQNNSQFRTSLSILYRIVDEEAQPGIAGGRSGWHLAFLHLVAPVKQDVARTGIAAFENLQAGVELDAKFFSTARQGVTYLASARYDLQRFPALSRTLHLFSIGLKMGW